MNWVSTEPEKTLLWNFHLECIRSNTIVNPWCKQYSFQQLMRYKFIFYSSAYIVGFNWAGICHCITETAILWAQLFIKRRILLEASYSGNFSFSVFLALQFHFRHSCMWECFPIKINKKSFSGLFESRKKQKKSIVLRGYVKSTEKGWNFCADLYGNIVALAGRNGKREGKNLPITSINIINDTFFSQGNQEFLFHLSWQNNRSHFSYGAALNMLQQQVRFADRQEHNWGRKRLCACTFSFDTTWHEFFYLSRSIPFHCLLQYLRLQIGMETRT